MALIMKLSAFIECKVPELTLCQHLNFIAVVNVATRENLPLTPSASGLKADMAARDWQSLGSLFT
jgi:hypothetical protein